MPRDVRSVTLGAVLCATLVGVFGCGSLWLLVRLTPGDAGVPIGGVAGSWILTLLLVGACSAYTSRRTRVGGNNGFRDGVIAGCAGFFLASAAGFLAFLSSRGFDFPILEEWVNLGTIALSGVTAALVGASRGAEG